MANYWAIAIGINQYELFQPLSCAQSDAEALKEFLVTEVGFLPQNCLLMTNTSPPIRERSSYPNQENILFLLEELAAKFWQPEDHLWFFFSGYGVNHNDKDYLMPADANPEKVLETGIKVQQVMESFHVAKLNVLLIFDINRAFGTQADAPVGEAIIDTAKKLQMAVMLSCQPEQFSHESTELGHGFFTSALLAALYAGKGSSFTDLTSYVSSLTPQLCQHHWRPVQNPVTVIPDNLTPILPILTLEPESATKQLIFAEENFAVTSNTPPIIEQESKNAIRETAWWRKNNNPQTTLTQTSSKVNQSIDGEQKLATSPELNIGSRFIPPSAQDYAKPVHQVNTPIWQQFILWAGGSMAIVALITTFLLRNQDIFRFNKLSIPLGDSTSNSEFSQSLPPISDKVETIQTPSSRVSSSDARRRNQAILELGKMSLSPNQASDLSKAIAITEKIPPGEILDQQAQENIQVWNQMILELAQEQAKQGKYADAIATATLINQNTSLYSPAQAAIKQWRLAAKQYTTNKILLDAANALIKPEQASSYSRAITLAKKVPPEQPGFDTAKKSINQWSEKILDLAKNRATQGQLTAAIETATLVPPQTAAYEDAQDAIQKWRSQTQE